MSESAWVKPDYLKVNTQTELEAIAIGQLHTMMLDGGGAGGTDKTASPTMAAQVAVVHGE